ncbi:MAG: hypothetical protein BWY82_02214 [Verrucomicrobia bacterium ADurb.Bin474]|nr:MAG: hypothetical protein BWY82_02214 [Verrucomicrobia bacterium ADurb.Bin474]
MSITPVGPIDPSTKRSFPAACLEILAAASLSSTVLSSSPKWDSFVGLAPKLLVRMMSDPASMYPFAIA